MAYDERLAHRLRELVWDEPDLTEKKMFGGLAFLIGGHMTVAASGNGGILVRVDPGLFEEMLAEPHARPMQMGGRSMPGWLHVAEEGVEDDAALRTWVTRALDFVYTLPPKE